MRRFLALVFLCFSLSGCGAILTGIGGVVFSLQDEDDDLIPQSALNRPPTATIEPFSGAVNDLVSIRYRISDPEADAADVTVQFAAGASSFQEATEAITGGSDGRANLETSDGGTEHVFVWNTPADLGFGDTQDVVVRVTPRDPILGREGGSDTTAPFDVLNTRIASVVSFPASPQLAFPRGMGTNGSRFLVADQFNNRIFEHVLTGTDAGRTSVLVGTGEIGFVEDDVPATDALLNQPSDVALALDGAVLIADAVNGRIRRVDPGTGFITTVAGGGGDPASEGISLGSVELVSVERLATEGTGAIYIIDDGSFVSGGQTITSRLRVLNPTGFPMTVPDPDGSGTISVASQTVRTLAGGASPQMGTSLSGVGDGGPGEDVILGTVIDLVPDGSGIFFLLTRSGLLLVSNQSLASRTILGQGVGPGEVRVVFDVAAATGVGSLGLGELGGVALDEDGNLFFTSQLLDAVWVINVQAGPITVLGTTISSGQAARVAGTGTFGLGGNGGPASEAEFAFPAGLLMQPNPGSPLFVSEAFSHRVRVINRTTGDLSVGGVTVGGEEIQTLPVQLEPEEEELIASPVYTAPGPDGGIFLTDSRSSRAEGNRLLRIDPGTGQVGVVAGNGLSAFGGDGGPATEASLNQPFGFVFYESSLLLVADVENHRIRAINTGTVSRSLLGVDIGPGRVETVVGTGVATTDATDVVELGDGGPAGDATLNGPRTVTVDPTGLILISDSGNHRLRAVNPMDTAIELLGTSVPPGRIETLIGNGTPAPSPGNDGDAGAASGARLTRPEHAQNAGGRLVLLDGGETAPRLRLVNRGTEQLAFGTVTVDPGEIQTIAGTGQTLIGGGALGDGGPATSATVAASGIAFWDEDHLLVSDADAQRIRLVNGGQQPFELFGVEVPSGAIDTVVGTGAIGFNGDPVPADEAQLAGPTGVSIRSGVVIFADNQNTVVRAANPFSTSTVLGGRVIDPNQVVVLAGTRREEFLIASPSGVQVDVAGTIFFSDPGFASPGVYRVDAETRVITRIVGNGRLGDAATGDGGAAISAPLNDPKGITLDPDGASLWIADAGNDRIRFANRTSAAATVLGTTVQPGAIDTVIGGGADPDGVTALTVSLGGPARAVTDGTTGAAWVADTLGGRVLGFDTNGNRTVTLPGPRLSGDTESVISNVSVTGIRFEQNTDPSGVLYLRLTDESPGAGQATIDFFLEPTFTTQVATASGPENSTLTITDGGSGSGLGGQLDLGAPTQNNNGLELKVAFDEPEGLFFDPSGGTAGRLYIAETDGGRIWSWDVGTGAEETTPIVGTGTSGNNGDRHLLTGMALNEPVGLDLDGDILFIADRGNHRLLAANLGTGRETVAGVTLSGTVSIGGDMFLATPAAPPGGPVPVTFPPVLATPTPELREFDTGVLGTATNLATPASEGVNTIQTQTDEFPAAAPFWVRVSEGTRVRYFEVMGRSADAQPTLTLTSPIVDGGGFSTGATVQEAPTFALLGPDDFSVDTGAGEVTLFANDGAALPDINYGGAGELVLTYDADRGEVVKVVGGSGGAPGYNGDAIPPVNATLNGPVDVVEQGGSVFVTDSENRRLRRFQR